MQLVHGHDIQYVQFFVHILEGPKGKGLHANETEMPCALPYSSACVEPGEGEPPFPAGVTRGQVWVCVHGRLLPTKLFPKRKIKFPLSQHLLNCCLEFSLLSAKFTHRLIPYNVI